MEEKPSQKVVIVSTQRSGSALLVSLLCSHPDVFFYREPFTDHSSAPYCFYQYLHKEYGSKLIARFSAHPHYSGFQWNFLSRILTKRFLNRFENQLEPFDTDGVNNVRGFNVMYGNINNNAYLRNWLKDKDVKVIHLIRGNILRLLVSKHLKDQTGISHITKQDESLKIEPVTLDVSHTLWQLKTMDKTISKWRKVLNRPNYHEVVYEEISNLETQKEILHFLGVPEKHLSSNQKKINTKRLCEIIENYQEIKDALKGTTNAWMLTD